MRRLALLATALIALSGCVQSQTTYEGPDDCFMFCGGESTTVEYNFVPITMLVLVVAGIIIAVVAIAASGGDRGGQQQQQQVVVVNKSDDDR